MKPCEIIKLLRSDNSKLFKQEVICKHMDNEQFVEGLKYALTPLITMVYRSFHLLQITIELTLTTKNFQNQHGLDLKNCWIS